jgi:hypothetical protein
MLSFLGEKMANGIRVSSGVALGGEGDAGREDSWGKCSARWSSAKAAVAMWCPGVLELECIGIWRFRAKGERGIDGGIARSSKSKVENGWQLGGSS